MLSEFRTFLLRGNVLDLAVGVIAGAAFGAVVTSLVQDVITPLVGLLFGVAGGEPDFSSWRLFAEVGDDWRASTTHAEADGGVLVGRFFNALLAFLLTMVAVFFFVVRPVNALTERLDGPDAPPRSPELRECDQCLAEVPLRARRCRYCTSQLGAPTSVGPPPPDTT